VSGHSRASVGPVSGHSRASVGPVSGQCRVTVGPQSGMSLRHTLVVRPAAREQRTTSGLRGDWLPDGSGSHANLLPFSYRCGFRKPRRASGRVCAEMRRWLSLVCRGRNARWRAGASRCWPGASRCWPGAGTCRASGWARTRQITWRVLGARRIRSRPRRKAPMDRGSNGSVAAPCAGCARWCVPAETPSGRGSWKLGASVEAGCGSKA
jgi:hypothetical protein